MNSLLQFLLEKTPELGDKIIEQIYLVAISTIIAMLIGIPLGIFTQRNPNLKTIILGSVSALWTIPSLAVLAFLIPFMGIGVKPAIIALAIYALLPILRNTVAGIDGVPYANIEAANGLGFTHWQRLYLIELPLAFPVIITGIRTAVSMGVGIATLAAFIGAGGLGDFINQGLALNNTRLILLGAIPAALMALIFDFLIARFEKAMQIGKAKKTGKMLNRTTFFISIAVIVFLTFSTYYFYRQYLSHRKVVIVGTKNFTEQIILGNMIADILEAKTHLTVIKKFNLGATSICQQAMLKGNIDMYPEYTGTAFMTVLHFSNPGTPDEVFNQVKQAYLKRFNFTWLPPFGFDNSEAIAVKQSFAKQNHLKTISDLIPIEKQLIIGVPAAFLERPDGFKGLKLAYNLNFGAVKQMDPGLMYKAIAKGSVNVITAFSTDGRIKGYHLIILKDDKHFYPPYYAAIVIRNKTLQKYPQMKRALAPLFGLINNQTMQRLNADVDIDKKSPAVVAKQFLQAHHLLRGS